MTQRKSQRSIIYRDGDLLVRPTGESPRNFEGVFFAVLQGNSPDSVVESVRTLDQLRLLEVVHSSSLSPEWLDALQVPISERTPAVSKAANRPSRCRPSRERGVSKTYPHDWRDELSSELGKLWGDPIVSVVALPLLTLPTLLLLAVSGYQWLSEVIHDRHNRKCNQV